jgi:hypothetical protein
MAREDEHSLRACCGSAPATQPGIRGGRAPWPCDWFPRKVIAEPAYLAKLPELLPAYVRNCHDRNGIRRDLTEETLAAVDRYKPEYLQLIHSDRQKSMAGRAEAILESERVKHLSDEEIHLEYIADEVGGVKRWWRSTLSR